MHRSSETIGKIATALAQAQRKLKNPEKTLTAAIVSPFPRESTLFFRYASLASGLEIIREALGQQEIAAIQRTEIDKQLGLIVLNTVLAHSSGEWIASDWPVCATSEVGAPHRLGAALTYARRYALFALVGIAGEDDLDAPDLPIAPANEETTTLKPGEASSRPRPRKSAILSPEQSTELRGQLLSELETLRSVDDLTLWALRRLPLKNRLTDMDAGIVEVAYEGRLASAQATTAPQIIQAKSANNAVPVSGNLAEPPRQDLINSASAFEPAIVQLPKTLRYRDKAHLAFVASQPCLVCQRAPSDAHHLRFAQPRALGRKTSDEFTVPLCREHHRELHRFGNERSWWASLGIAPLEVADRLWWTTQRDRSVALLPISTTQPGSAR